MTNILGINTIKVIHHAPCPVLTVPLHAEFRPIQRIAWATDLKNTSQETLACISGFARAFEAYLDIVHVSEKAVDIRELSASLQLPDESVRQQFFDVVSSHVEKGIEQHIEH